MTTFDAQEFSSLRVERALEVVSTDHAGEARRMSLAQGLRQSGPEQP